MAEVVKLSTAPIPDLTQPVDESSLTATAKPLAAGPPSGLWLGAVVPKRHARRAVTRSLLKRQIRAAMVKQMLVLPAGLWVIRLRAPFDMARFPSACSTALRDAARDELNRLVASALQRGQAR